MLGSQPIIAFIPTKDFRKARSFYEQTLGLRFVSDDGFALVFDANGVMLRIAKASEFKPQPFTILGWKVDDIGDFAGQLSAKGITFERYSFLQQDGIGIWSSPDGAKVAWFKDPDGNLLSISQHP
ncbi:VOC family protein [Terriglobus albidus]|uniref:VOC family protein n=1 Tax=Terriglobus albidus TaxID=1592106 RepID=A0A5B9E5L4_9BACT|nr:VOC family protein [Terriglobus albidus]QEE27573.1 VOC family protein [Terriglobus albidus]